MAGIYLHIPFCKQKCNYCDFYSIVSDKKKSEFVDTLLKEIDCRKSYLNEKVETIYFGGGTPSILSSKDIEIILNQLSKQFAWAESVEITLEANPENISKTYLSEIQQIGVNRLSMGIQSFSDTDLQFLKRTHTAQQAIDAVKIAQDKGFDNISLDLIYGLPNSTINSWRQNLQTFFDLNVQHLSAYHLTYEEGTALYRKLKQGKVQAVSENLSLEQFHLLIRAIADNGFEMYEISNFAQNGAYSKHNTSYWQQKPYLGLGPSAHSFNLSEREWNVSALSAYIQGIQKGERAYEKEILRPIDLVNEYLITRLRTKWGLQQNDFKTRFGEHFWCSILKKAQPYIQSQAITSNETGIKLSHEGIFISDKILEDLFIV